MLASAALDTLFSDTTAPTLTPVPPARPVSELASASLWLFTSELRSAAAVALTSTAPPALTVVSRIFAVAPEPVFAPNALAIAGSPISASIVLNRMFCDCQPIVLNASVAATAVSPPDTTFSTLASTVASFAALTVTSLPAPVVVTALFDSVAVAPASTRLVAISPPAASESPAPKSPAPPSFCNSLVSSAVSVADAVAVTLTSPPALSVALSIVAVAPPRTSFSDTAPDTANDVPSANGLPVTADERVASVVVAAISAASSADTVTPAEALIVFASA